MRLVGFEKLRSKGAKLAGALLATVISGAALPAAADELVIRIEHVRAVDRIDPTTSPDFYAQVTIDGQVFKTQRIRNAPDIRPNWVITANVPRGISSVNLAILDRDILKKDDLIDINRVDGKRDLDFRVNTRSCEILDFSQSYSCRDRIVRAGNERKAAEITFRVEVQRRR
jgi:hypothetical protein